MSAEVIVHPSTLAIPKGEPPTADVIRLLEEKLEQARRGELRAVAIVSVYGNLGTGTIWSGDRRIAWFTALMCGAGDLLFRIGLARHADALNRSGSGQ